MCNNGVENPMAGEALTEAENVRKALGIAFVDGPVGCRACVVGSGL